MIDIKCPKCSRVFHVKEDLRGVVVECGSCNVTFEVPTTGSVGLMAAAVPNIAVVCPGCRTTHQVPGNAGGLEAECMVCKRSFRIPESNAQPSVPALAEPAARPAPRPQSARGVDFGDTSTIRLTRSSAKFQANTMAPSAPDSPKPHAPTTAVPVSKPVAQQFPPPTPSAIPAPAATPARLAAPSAPPPPASTKPAVSAARRESEQSQRVLGRIPAFHLEPDEEIIDSKDATSSGIKRSRLLFALPVVAIWGAAFLSYVLRWSWIFPLMLSVIGSLCWILLAAGPLLGARNRLWLVVSDKRVVMGSGKDTLTINRTG